MLYAWHVHPRAPPCACGLLGSVFGFTCRSISQQLMILGQLLLLDETICSQL